MDFFSPATRRRAALDGRAAPRASAWAAPVLLLVLVLSAALAACAGDGSLPGLAPPQTQVPAVETEAFPTLGAPPADRREPLTAEQQQKLQRDLERLARQQPSQ